MNDDVGRRLLELRQMLGMTQKNFGEKIRFSRGYLTSLEKNRRPVNDRTIKLIADTYGINEEWLKNGKGEIFLDPQDNELQGIMAIFNRLNPDFQHFILNQLKDLLKMNHNYRVDKRDTPAEKDKK